jgi:hypothetical protein
MVQKRWSCQVVRYLTIFFPTVSLNNLIVIGVERYVAVFRPFFAISNRTTKKLIVAAWIGGALITLVPVSTYDVIRQDIGPGSYTLICKYDNTVPIYRIMILGFTLIVYIIPSIILIVTSVLIIRYLFQRKLLGTRKNIGSTSWRFKRTSMFISLIFAFVIPYLLYVIYLIINVIFGGEISYKNDYIIRRSSALMAFSNTVVNPIILYFSMNGLRRMLRDLTLRFYHFIRRCFYNDMFVVNEYMNSPRTNVQGNRYLAVPPPAWRQRRRRNGIGAVGRNVIEPEGLTLQPAVSLSGHLPRTIQTS